MCAFSSKSLEKKSCFTVKKNLYDEKIEFKIARVNNTTFSYKILCYQSAHEINLLLQRHHLPVNAVHGDDVLLLRVEGDGVDPGEELLQVGLDHGRAGGLGSKDRCATNVYLAIYQLYYFYITK